MAMLDWGASQWDVDSKAESLNKDLFGVKKNNKRSIMVPDSDIGKKNVSGPIESDDEQFSKKARKKMKEKTRKLNKKNDEVGDEKESEKINMQNENESKQIVERTGKADSQKKKRKKKDKTNDKDQNHETDISKKSIKAVKADQKEVSDLPKTDGKKKKRKISESENINGQENPVKKLKISETASKEGTGEEQGKKKKSANKKKKNNSKKNKYKHLALNTTKQTDVEAEQSNDAVKKVVTNEKSSSKVLNSISQTQSQDLNFTSSSAHNQANSQSETTVISKKKKKNQKSKKDIDINMSGDGLKSVDASSKSIACNNGDETVKCSKKKVNTKMKESDIKTQQHKLDKLSSQASGDTTDYIPSKREIKRQKKRERFLSFPTKGDDINGDSKLNSLPGHNSANTQQDNIPSKREKKRQKKMERSLSKSMKGDDINGGSKLNSLPGHNSANTQQDKTSTKAKESLPSNPTNDLKAKATEKLNAARFRFINEQLYTCKGHEAMQLFRQDQEAFRVYHRGFQSQTDKWPVNPLNSIIKHIMNRPKELVIADFGCGEAKLSESVEQKVHSFDLLALNDRVTACDMSKTPLADDSIDIAVFCLSLMGTNLSDYILEANRVLKQEGLLKIAEVVSRFSSIDQFIKHISSFGFLLLNKRDIRDMFFMMDFKKVKRVKKSPFQKALTLKPCVYKKR